MRKTLHNVTLGKSGIQLSNGDVEMVLELHNRLEPIDHKCMTHIAENTDLLDLVEVTRHCTIHTLLINQLARETLKISAYSNHHARELQTDYMLYCERKLGSIFAKLNRYCWILESEVPESRTIGRFVSRWLHYVVIPPVISACEKKISFYDGLLRRRNISEARREDITGWRKKNVEYIENLRVIVDKLSGESGILDESKIITLNSACLGCDTLVSTITPMPSSRKRKPDE